MTFVLHYWVPPTYDPYSAVFFPSLSWAIVFWLSFLLSWKELLYWRCWVVQKAVYIKCIACKNLRPFFCKYELKSLLSRVIYSTGESATTHSFRLLTLGPIIICNFPLPLFWLACYRDSLSKMPRAIQRGQSLQDLYDETQWSYDSVVKHQDIWKCAAHTVVNVVFSVN